MINASMKPDEPIKIAVLAMGGQGGAVLCNWIIQTAERCHYFAQSTSVPGVAQRTGATIYYIEILPHTDKTDKNPLLALMPVPGHVDVVVAGELIESGRAILRGLVTPDRTTTIVSTHRDYAIAEKAAIGDGRVDSHKLIEQGEKHSKTFIGFDMASLAEENESVISSILFGSIAAAGVLPFEKAEFEAIITHSGIAVEANLKGFNAGYSHTQQKSDTSNAVTESPTAAKAQNRQLQAILTGVENSFPQVCREIIFVALRKLIDYQDLRYAEDYLNRLDKILKLDNAEKDYLLTRETARYLALWMTYEDTVRVADLKTRATRFTRVRKEVQSDSEQPVRIHEYMHPRIEEICDTLPAALGTYCLKNNICRAVLGSICNKDRKITTTSLSGFLLLYSLAALRRFRRFTLRYKRELAAMQQWLSTIETTAAANYQLAVEISECQRLVKGYGETHERGMKNFNTIMQTLDDIRDNVNAADTVRQLREAAFADETDEKLQQQLKKIA